MIRSVFGKGLLLLAGSFLFFNLQFIINKPDDQLPLSVEFDNSLNSLQIQQILKIYNQFAGQPQNNTSKKLFFSFSSDVDMHVSVVDLMNSLECQPVYPANYQTVLQDTEDICFTLLYFFTRGLGSEIYVENYEQFQALVDVAETIQQKSDLGGNSATMALRGFKEGADVYLQSVMSQHYYENLFNSSITVFPGVEERIRDVHMVVNFVEGEKYYHLICPRTNRLYLQSDRDNIEFPGLSVLADKINEIKPAVFGIGGFQLMNSSPKEVNQRIIQELSDKLDQMRQDVKIHFEIGAFTDNELIRELIEKIFNRVHSFGMNEQELVMLTQFIENDKLKQDEQSQSTNEMIKSVMTLIEYLKRLENQRFERQYGGNIQKQLIRIHFHATDIQMICSNNQEWKDQKFALSRSILVGLMQAMKVQNDNEQDMGYENSSKLQVCKYNYIKYQQSQQPQQIVLATLDNKYKEKQVEYHKINAQSNIEDIINCWQISDDLNCCIAPALTNANPKRTSGLGDNIAATSLIYQI